MRHKDTYAMHGIYTYPEQTPTAAADAAAVTSLLSGRRGEPQGWRTQRTWGFLCVQGVSPCRVVLCHCRRIAAHAWTTTTILPPASLASMTRCASRISSKRKTRVGFALRRPAATCA